MKKLVGLGCWRGRVWERNYRNLEQRDKRIWRIVLGNNSAFLFSYERINDVLGTIQAKLFRVVLRMLLNFC